jgi:hypothetical protein
LVATQEQAWDALAYLAKNLEVRKAIGRAAQAQAERLHGGSALKALVASYLDTAVMVSGTPKHL